MAKSIADREQEQLHAIEVACKTLRECWLERAENVAAEYVVEREEQKQAIQRLRAESGQQHTKWGTYVPANVFARIVGKTIQIAWWKRRTSKGNGNSYKNQVPKGAGTRYSTTALTNDAPRWAWDLIKDTERKAAAIRVAQTEVKALEVQLTAVKRRVRELVRKAIGKTARSLDDLRLLQESDRDSDAKDTPSWVAPKPPKNDWTP